MLIQIILISNDQDYSYAVLTDLSAMGRKFSVSELEWSENLAFDFEIALVNGQYKTPTIVMLDFGLKHHQYKMVIDRIQAVKDAMAIECIALRPPADPELFANLRAHGLSIFDGVPTSPAVVAEAIH